MERIDLATHGKAIGAAYDEIRNCTSSNTWVVFGYDGKSPTIVVKERGEDWDELVDEMSASKILYAYVRVLDPNTNLNKFVLINWSGEGVPSNIKGPRAYHIPDMERLLHTKHVTIQARHEDDLDEKVVKDKVAKSSGSNYSFHKEKPRKPDSVAPVGSVYAKTDAQGEITSSGRSKFWQRQDTEEQSRIQGESERISRTRSEADRNQKERDSQESTARDQRTDARQKTIDSQKAQERQQWTRAEEERKRREQDQFDVAGRELAQEKESAAHQIPSYRQEASSVKSSAPIPEYATQATPPVIPMEHAGEPVRMPMRPPLPQEDLEDSPERGYGVPEPDEDLTYDTAHDVAPVESQDIYDDITQQPGDVEDQSAGMYDEIGETLQGMQVQDPAPEAPAEDIYDEIDPTAAAPQAAGFSVRAIYDYTAAEEGEISFDPGDIITNVDPIDEGWWQGTAPNGEFGLFPATYVEHI